MDDNSYKLHAIDANATTDPNDVRPIWLDIFYWTNEMDGTMDRKTVEMSVGDAKRLINMLNACLELVKSGQDFSMYDD